MSHASASPATPPSGTADPSALPPPSNEPGFLELRAAWWARFAPADLAEAAALDALVAALWRRARLDRLEARLLEAQLAGEADPKLPSLALLCRYGARLARDIEQARARFFA
ncbi:MAG: hypothetical protein N3D77_10555, partial [Geminicoccaceae bacterium]|nr:hypothetical protein [Geminicoccaceae bacterium]